jgi:hypothetical protein
LVVTTKTFGVFSNTAYVSASGAYDPISSNNTSTVTPALAQMLECDVNRDQKINIDDINLILAVRDTQTSALDPRDLDGDGWITVNDSRGCVLRCDYETCVVLPRATVNVNYPTNTDLANMGATMPYNFGITSGALPAGMNLVASTGILSGKPTVTGAFPFSATITDAGGRTFVNSYTLYVDEVFSITTSSLPNGSTSAAYNQTLAATGGATAGLGSAPYYKWSITIGTLPAGLTLNSSSGAISGTPTAIGISNFTVKALDRYGRIITKPLSITVN